MPDGFSFTHFLLVRAMRAGCFRDGGNNMSDDIAQPVEGAQQGEPVEPLGENGVKALQAEREARKAAERQISELQAALNEHEKAQLSELERAQAEADEAKAALESVRREALVNKIALEKSVPADLVQFLSGSDEESLLAQADVLVSRLNQPRTPKPDPSQGGQASQAPATKQELFGGVLESIGFGG